MCDTVLFPNVVERQKAQLFYRSGDQALEKAIGDCLKTNRIPVSLPQLVDARIATGNAERVLWTDSYDTSSIMVFGRTKKGKPVVAFDHGPHYFFEPGTISKAREAGFVDGMGKMPRDEFYTLLDREDKESVFVVDYVRLQQANNEQYNLSHALGHCLTLPLFGDLERAEQYFLCIKSKHVEALSYVACPNIFEYALKEGVLAAFESELESGPLALFLGLKGVASYERGGSDGYKRLFPFYSTERFDSKNVRVLGLAHQGATPIDPRSLGMPGGRNSEEM